MNSRKPVRLRVPGAFRLSAVLVLLVAIVTGCSSRRAREAEQTTTDTSLADTKPSSSVPVTAVMETVPPEVRAGGTFELLVRVEIADVHYIYASNAAGKPFTPTTLNVTLPAGVEVLGDWTGPEPTRKRNGDFIYTDSVSFHRPLRVRANVPAGALSMKGELHYQACTEELCWPPHTLQLSAPVRVHSP